MAKTYHFNNASGCYTEIEDTSDGGLILRTMQDVKPVLDHIQRRRDSGYVDRGIKKDWWNYATIPMSVVVKMRTEGYDIFNKEQTQECLRHINQHYPYLKNTYLHHE